MGKHTAEQDQIVADVMKIMRRKLDFHKEILNSYESSPTVTYKRYWEEHCRVNTLRNARGDLFDLFEDKYGYTEQQLFDMDTISEE